MFKLLRYFSIASAVAMTIAAAILLVVYREDQLRERVHLAHEDNVYVAGTFSTTFWPQFVGFVGMSSRFSAEELRRRGEIRAMSFAVKAAALGHTVAKVKIYTQDGRTIFSTVADDIGSIRGDSYLLQEAMAGKANSDMRYRPSFRVAEDELSERFVVETYVPILGRGGEVEGVFEVYSDITATMERMNAATLRLLLMVAVGFVTLYGVLFVIVAHADRILRRQHAELEETARDLTESEARFRAVTRSAADAIVSIDGDGKVVSWNDGARDAFHYDEEEIIGRPVTIIIPDRYHAAHTAGLAKWLSTGHSHLEGSVMGFEARRRDGAEFPVELVLSSWQVEGRPHFTAIIRDVTERRQAETALKSSAASLANAQRMARLGSWEWHLDEDRLVWSREAFRIFGLDPESFTPSYDAFIAKVHADDRAVVRRAVDRALSQQAAYSIDHRIVLPDGSIRTVHQEAEVEFAADGRPLRMLGAVQDITDRQESEDRLRRTLDELMRSNAELERFAYVASHDLQEPVRTVISFSQLLERRLAEKLEDRDREYLNFIIEGAKRMQALVRDLLDYSRVTHKDSPFAPVDCSYAFKSACRNLDALIGEREAKVEAGPLPVVMGDEIQIMELLQNLIANAIKFAREGVAPMVNVAATMADGGNGMWEFTVADNGIGIEPRYHDQIFAIFKRLHSSAVYPGTGIGLAVCKRIVERHGGRIWVDSQPGQGTTFHFTLPAGDG